MATMRVLGLAGGLLAAVLAAVMFQPPGDDEKGPGKKGPPGKRFILGKLLPPHIHEGLELSAEQEKQLKALEAEVKAKLEKILTAEQRAQIEKLAKRRPPGPPPGDDEKGPPPGKGKGKGKDKKGPPRDDDEKGPPKKGPPEAKLDTAPKAIAWFTELKQGLAEAKRAGKPILLVSAAPHCAGVSGIW
jgi:Spy/CpxP family protein refolding chaperone